MTTYSVEVVYRGVFQRTLSRNICRGIVLAARKEGKLGTAFSRYSDSPERNGIPAKYFAVVADEVLELEDILARYQPTEVDVTICLDDTLCKGMESWGWDGLNPVNALTKDGGTLLITSRQTSDMLLEDIHQKDVPYNLALVTGPASFSGLWVYKDDHTDVRILGALAQICPGLVSLDSYCEAIVDQWKSVAKVTSARHAYEQAQIRVVEPAEGNPETPFSFPKPGWEQMEEGLLVPAIAPGTGFRGGEGGFQPGRNELFKKFSTRTMRPIVNFESCTKCTLCWLQCPDTCFDVTPDGLYDPSMEVCCGCGVCQDVCPVSNCITMVNESHFNDNSSLYDWYQKDKEGYLKWLGEITAPARAESRAHGLHHWGQYEEELAATPGREVSDDD